MALKLGTGSATHLLPNYVPPMACYEVTFSFLCSVKEISYNYVILNVVHPVVLL
jgi:hypothetical protein